MSSMSPLSARPGTPEGEARRARIVVLLVVLGVSASLLAYALSPGVRHAVSHAAHSVKRAVGHVFDRDAGEKAKPKHTTPPAPARTPPRTSTTAPSGAGASVRVSVSLLTLGA
jgi:hypothetical protein